MSEEFFKLTYIPDRWPPSTLEEVAPMERPAKIRACRELIRLFALDINQRAGLHIDDVIQLFSGISEWVTSRRHVWERSQVKVKWWRCCDCQTIDNEKAFFKVGTTAICPKCGKTNAVKITEDEQVVVENELKKRSAPMTPREMLHWAEETDRVLVEEATAARAIAEAQRTEKRPTTRPPTQEEPGDRKTSLQCPLCHASVRSNGVCEACGADFSCVNVELFRAAQRRADCATINELLRPAPAETKLGFPGARVLAAKVEEKFAERKSPVPETQEDKKNCICEGHSCPVCSSVGTYSKIINHYCQLCGTTYCSKCHGITKALVSQAYSSCSRCKCNEVD